MPPRRPSESAFEFEPPRKRISPNGFKLPEPIREGEVLTDLRLNQWRLGKSIGVGGFGEIYLADEGSNRYVGLDVPYAIKVEPHKNGPLFVEMHFYIRAAKREKIEDFKQRKRLKHLGIPPYLGSGSHYYGSEKYRFLVLERYGRDLNKMLELSGGKFHLKTALYIAMQILDCLEYIHEEGYVHADIKGSNILLGYTKETENNVYLLDYGLACKYLDRTGVHKVLDNDQRKAHDGTIEFTSRDAHVGAHSRRGDLEILGYNLLQWLCGRLPWEDNLADPEYVHQQKMGYMANVPSLMRRCFEDSVAPDVMAQYLKYVNSLSFETRPDYDYLRRLLKRGIKDAHFVDDGKLVFGMNVKVPMTKISKHKIIKNENLGAPKKKKIVRLVPRQPCAAHNFNRMTRNSAASPALRSKHFDWAKVLLTDPEKHFKKMNLSARKNNNARSDTPVHFGTPQKTVGGQRQRLTSTSSECWTSAENAETLKNPTKAILNVVSILKKKATGTTPSVSMKRKSDYNTWVDCPQEVSIYPYPTLTYAMEELLDKVLNKDKTDEDSSNVCQIMTRSRKRSNTSSAVPKLEAIVENESKGRYKTARNTRGRVKKSSKAKSQLFEKCTKSTVTASSRRRRSVSRQESPSPPPVARKLRYTSLRK